MKYQSLILGIALIIFLGIGQALIKHPSKEPPVVACPADAKICPGGSAVGRIAPLCEFAVCPVSQVPPLPEPEPTTVSGTALGEKITMNDVSLTPLALVEDSRCPADVVCIQAGTVRVKIKIEDEGKSMEAVVNMDTPIILGTRTVLLVGVLPVSRSTQKITLSDYRFQFSVSDLGTSQRAE